MARVRTVRIVVIGGGRNVGSFLVPRLVRAGPEVVNLTPGAPRSLRLRPGVVGGRSDPSGPGGRDVRGPGWFGQTGRTRSVSWAEFRSGTTAEYADSSWKQLFGS